MPETIDQAPEVKRRRAKPAEPGKPGPANRELYKLSPNWHASQKAKGAQTLIPAATQLPSAQGIPSHDVKFDAVLRNQELALHGASSYALQAVEYLGAVATGRKRGEQWRMRACEGILDRAGVTWDAVERARAAAQESAGGDAGALLRRLEQAITLRARAAQAVDAVQQPSESGQTSGTPAGG